MASDAQLDTARRLELANNNKIMKVPGSRAGIRRTSATHIVNGKAAPASRQSRPRSPVILHEMDNLPGGF